MIYAVVRCSFCDTAAEVEPDVNNSVPIPDGWAEYRAWAPRSAGLPALHLCPTHRARIAPPGIEVEQWSAPGRPQSQWGGLAFGVAVRTERPLHGIEVEIPISRGTEGEE